jgi:ABC-type multidrug transport system ATPase subunit
MIILKNLYLEDGDFHLSDVSLQVQGGEIYFLLIRQNAGNDSLFNALSGFRALAGGEIRYDACLLSRNGPPRSVALIDRVVDASDFETEARIGAWIDFLCSSGGFAYENVLQTLMVLNFNEMNLQKKVRDLPPEIFRQVYLALCLAADAPNIVVNDFSKGTEKSLEMKFNKLLWKKKAAGQAILYLGNDVLYAAEIADRVGFVKNGQLLFEAEAADIKEMDIKDLYSKFLS